MSFEQTLRDELRREAAAVPLPGREPDVAVGRARHRRKRRRTAVAAVAAVAILAVAVPPLVRNDGADVSVMNPASTGLTPTGPLDLDWRAVDGGLYDMRSAFPGDAGVIYALSTGPGVRYEDHPDGDLPRALYRLGDDGTWQPVALDGDRPRAIDVSGADGLLYAVSTGPASGGDGTVARLSTSADGGETWSAEDVPAVDPPSSETDWQPSVTMAVESTSSVTLAAVTTTFYPDIEALFPEMADQDYLDTGYSVEQREEGLVLVRYDVAEGDPTMPTTSAPVPEDEAAREAPTDVEVEAEAWLGGGEDVRTIPRSELGVDGIDALSAHHQLFRRAGDVWEPVGDQADGLSGLTSIDLGVAGDEFVVTGWTPAGADSTVLTSADGVSWSPVPGPTEGRVVGVGPALVDIPWDGTTLRVSGDAGATWSEVDLAQVAGVADGSMVLGADGGPLGLALVVGREGGEPEQVVVSGDLVDWTATPLADVVGSDAESTFVQPVVGDDRIVLSATGRPTDSGEPAPSRTAIGTPTRTP